MRNPSRLQAAHVLPITALKERLSRGVRIRLPGTCPRETIEALWDVLTRHRWALHGVAVEVEMNGGSVSSLATEPPQFASRRPSSLSPMCIAVGPRAAQ